MTRLGARARPALLVAAALALLAAAGGVTAATVHTVTIDGFGFKPQSLVVNEGDTVVWRNDDPVPHTATGKDGGIDSGEIAAGASYRLVARKKGRFAYICTFHPIMKGELIVE